jgi:hypothetical protein
MCIRNRVLRRLYRLLLCLVCGWGIYVHLTGTPNPLYLLWYFTLISNVLVFVYFVNLLVKDLVRGRRFHEGPRAKGAITMCIVLTGVVYNVVLGQMFGKGSIPLAGNLYVHILTPILVFADYLLFSPKGEFGILCPWLWTLIPLLYLVAIYLRVYLGGAPFPGHGTTSYYPYPFLDIDLYGIQQVATNLVTMAVGYVLSGYLYVLLDRILGGKEARRRRKMRRHHRHGGNPRDDGRYGQGTGDTEVWTSDGEAGRTEVRH